MLLLAGVVTACTPATRPGILDAVPFAEIASEIKSGREEGRVARLVPVGYDPDGCLMYRLDAPDRRTVEAVVYRTAEGRITLDRGQADCSAPEGSRADGLPAGGG